MIISKVIGQVSKSVCFELDVHLINSSVLLPYPPTDCPNEHPTTHCSFHFPHTLIWGDFFRMCYVIRGIGKREHCIALFTSLMCTCTCTFVSDTSHVHAQSRVHFSDAHELRIAKLNA